MISILYLYVFFPRRSLDESINMKSLSLPLTGVIEKYISLIFLPIPVLKVFKQIFNVKFLSLPLTEVAEKNFPYEIIFIFLS